MQVTVPVAPEVLRWACRRARITPETLRRQLPKVEKWFSGEEQPTLRQLERIAELTRTPVGFFFLAAPPREEVPIPDFRTIGSTGIAEPSADLLDTIYLCLQRQEWYREFAVASGQPELEFVGSARPSDDVVATAEQIRQVLGFDVEARRQLISWTEAFRQFVRQAEQLGVLVMTSAVVGNNNHRKLDPNEFRGFALSDRYAPLVFVNGADTRAAQMFTIAHELAHLWLGTTALSDVSLVAASTNHIEQWCNAVAAEVLVPLSELRQRLSRHETLDATVQRLAREFKVSTLVILRRLYDAGEITRRELQVKYTAELSRLRVTPRSEGGDYYRTALARVGERFARAIVAAAWEGHTSFTEAMRLLGLRRVSTLERLSHQLGVIT